MEKSDLVGEAVARIGVSWTNATGTVDAIFGAVAAVLVRPEQVRMAGFGPFATRDWSTRGAPNPRTGDRVATAASTASTFKPTKVLRGAVNGSATPCSESNGWRGRDRVRC